MKTVSTLRQPHDFSFDLEPGTVLAGKFTVVEHLGQGWQGEVYLVRERSTGIERSLKIFYPQRNIGNRTVRQYAQKLHRMRGCPVLIRYHAQESIVLELGHKGIPGAD